MQSRLKCEKPGEIEYTLTVTMKADEWEKLRDQIDASKLATSYPSYNLVREINDLLSQARKIYWPREEIKVVHEFAVGNSVRDKTNLGGKIIEINEIEARVEWNNGQTAWCGLKFLLPAD